MAFIVRDMCKRGRPQAKKPHILYPTGKYRGGGRWVAFHTGNIKLPLIRRSGFDPFHQDLASFRSLSVYSPNSNGKLALLAEQTRHDNKHFRSCDSDNTSTDLPSLPPLDLAPRRPRLAVSFPAWLQKQKSRVRMRCSRCIVLHPTWKYLPLERLKLAGCSCSMGCSRGVAVDCLQLF